jgi:hypothetical protein
MRIGIPLKCISWLLLVLMLTLAINVMHDSAHALQGHLTTAHDQATPSKISTSHHGPCTPFEQHKDHDGCDLCINCACHAPQTIHSFQFCYIPLIVSLCPSDIFKHLPEVYFPKFIPPQIRA